MASAIRLPESLRRTLTIYGDVNRLTQPLGIDDRSTIAVVLVDAEGKVAWSGKGGFDPILTAELAQAL